RMPSGMAAWIIMRASWPPPTMPSVGDPSGLIHAPSTTHLPCDGSGVLPQRAHNSRVSCVRGTPGPGTRYGIGTATVDVRRVYGQRLSTVGNTDGRRVMNQNNDPVPDFEIEFRGDEMEPHADVVPEGPVTFQLINDTDDAHDFALVALATT